MVQISEVTGYSGWFFPGIPQYLQTNAGIVLSNNYDRPVPKPNVLSIYIIGLFLSQKVELLHVYRRTERL
jgi:hypothetical protein